ncbi:MAG: sugar phosphate isomerase/epimerase [Planctomycetes bacterium]|nr:sugar phosphate isomerase/epimerase [Planctomycetota bacterium]
MPTVSFTTANYAGRALRYDTRADWAEHIEATIRSTSTQVLGAILTDIKDAGFGAVDVWMCHCDWQAHAADDFATQTHKQIKKAGLRVATYAGGASVSSREELQMLFGFMELLGAPILSGIIWGLDEPAPIVQDICEKCDLRWARENHEEKSTDEMLAQISGGKLDRCGLALDTGWCARQDLDALEAVKAVRERLFVMHLKDMKAGATETCVLGDGDLPVEQIVRYLVETGWTGAICIEHEPLHRDPMPQTAESLKRLTEWLT